MRIVLEDSKDYEVFKDICKPYIRNYKELCVLFGGLRIHSKSVICSALIGLLVDIEEYSDTFCTFTTASGFRFFMEQVGKTVEIDITKL